MAEGEEEVGRGATQREADLVTADPEDDDNFAMTREEMEANEYRDVPPRISWTQPVCPTCFAAIEVGRGNVPREPSRVTSSGEEPCLICGGHNDGIYTRVDPKIAGVFRNARREDV